MPATRRRFLALTTAALAAHAAPTFLRAASTPASSPSTSSPARPRPLGFSLYGMKTLPVLDALEHVARIGYRQIELCLLPGFPTEPAAFSAASRRAISDRVRALGLAVSSLMLSLNLPADARTHTANLDKIKAAGELAHQLDDQTPPLVETIMGGKPDAWETTKHELAARLRTWGETAAAAGITLCVKAHADHAVNSPGRLIWIYQQASHPHLALNYDYSHFQYAGFALDESLRLLLPHTRHVSVKDVVPRQRPATFLLPGDGHIDYAHYFRLLDAALYTGPLVVEVSAQLSHRPGYDGVQSATRAYAALSAALAAPQ
jgi:inosose dehydratase